MKNLLAKLLSVQKELKPLVKDLENPYYKSKYADINSVLALLRPLLNKYGLVALQPMGVEDGTPAILTCVYDPESGEKLETATPLPQNPDPQKQGAVITYFRRYALVSFFMLESEDDDANSAVEAPKAAATAYKYPAPKPYYPPKKATGADLPF